MDLNALLFFTFFCVIILQRVSELVHAHRNTRRVREMGAREYGAGHYPAIVALHVIGLACLALEAYWNDFFPNNFWPIPLTLFLLAQGLRYWSIATLGPYWNTRVWVVPGMTPIRSGPYRYIRHPNYLAVVVEFVTITALWNAWWTLAVVTPVNLILLGVRIRCEENALNKRPLSQGQVTSPSRTENIV